MGKTKDFAVQFETLKKFKEEFSELTESDEFFKSLYARMRKYVKKWNKIQETEGKIKSGTSVTKDQKDMLNKKSELVNSLEELDFLISQYTGNFQAHCDHIQSFAPKEEAAPAEEVKEEVVEEEETPEPQPQITEEEIEEFKKEGYNNGFENGRSSGFEEGKKQGYDQGKKDGISQANKDFEAQEPEIPTEDIERAVNYYALIHIMGHWVDSLVPLNPQFKRTDYFTEEECLAIKQMYISNVYVPVPLNFGSLTGSLREKVLKMVNRSSETVNNPMAMNLPRPAGQDPLTYSTLAESFDRVLSNSKFNETNHLYLTAGNGEMMGVNMYGQMPTMLSGGMMPNYPVVPNQVPQEPVQISIDEEVREVQVEAPAPVQTESAQKEQADEPEVEAEAETQEVEVAAETSAPYQSIPADTTPEASPEDIKEAEPVQQKTSTDLWKDDPEEDDNDDDDENEFDDDTSDEEPPKEEEDKAPQETAQAATQEQEVTEKDKGFYDSKPYDRRGGRGFGRGYHNRGHRGHRGQYRGGRGYNKNYDTGYRGRGRGNYEGGRGRGNYRGGRGRGGYYQKDDYHQDDRKYYQQKQEEDMEDDGFNLVKEKTFTNKKKRRGGVRPKPTPKAE